VFEKISYRIARWFFRRHLDRLVREHVDEIARRTYLAFDIADRFFDEMIREVDESYMDILIGECLAKSEDGAIQETEKIIKQYNEAVERIMKLREKFYSVVRNHTFSITAVKLIRTLGSIIALSMLGLAFNRIIRDGIKKLEAIEVESDV